MFIRKLWSGAPGDRNGISEVAISGDRPSTQRSLQKMAELELDLFTQSPICWTLKLWLWYLKLEYWSWFTQFMALFYGKKWWFLGALAETNPTWGSKDVFKRYGLSNFMFNLRTPQNCWFLAAGTKIGTIYDPCDATNETRNVKSLRWKTLMFTGKKNHVQHVCCFATLKT